MTIQKFYTSLDQTIQEMAAGSPISNNIIAQQDVQRRALLADPNTTAALALLALIAVEEILDAPPKHKKEILQKLLLAESFLEPLENLLERYRKEKDDEAMGKPVETLEHKKIPAAAGV